VTVFHHRGGGVFEAVGQHPMQIRVSYDDGRLKWAWHWGTGHDDVIERSRATCRRVDC
jgi:hypothetical protein